ncbi:MAG: M1 family aminopeptidase [Myxococcota bacterium]
MRQFVSLGVFPVLVGVLPFLHGCGAPAQGQDVAWYDPAPLLANLRADDRRNVSSYTPHGPNAVPYYDLDLSLAHNQTRFEMDEEVWFTNTTGGELEDLVLRVFANSVGDSPRIRVSDVRCVAATCTSEIDARHGAITVRPETAIPEGGRLRVRLRLNGALTHIDPQRTGMMAQAMESQAQLSSGNLHGDYGLLAESNGVASLGNFYAMVAARRGGRWVKRDESTMGDLGSGDISHFRARIRCAPGSRVAVSGHVLREETVLGQPTQHEVRAVAGMVRNFAIVVSDRLEFVQREVNGVTVRSWFEPADRSEGATVLASAAEALRIFERRFGPYPYTDLDVVEAPLVGGAGGVEFSGLVTIAKMFYPSGDGAGLGIIGALMNRQGSGPGMRESMLEFVVAHEVAHQWWHGVVGSDARLHPFVDESLAQFSSVRYMRDRHGAERAELESRRQVASNYHMMRNQGLEDGAVDRPVASFQHPMAYAGLVYGKGAFAYRETERVVGEAAFYRALRRYVRENRFGVAEPRSLFSLLARGRHRRAVRRIERRWLDGTHGDEDLGAADMGRMMADWFGGGGEGGAGGMLDQVMQLLGGTGNAPPNLDADALQDALRSLQ